MATKKATKATSPANPDAFKVTKSEKTESQVLSELVAGGVLSAATLKTASGAGDALSVADLVDEMRKAGDEAVAGDMGRVERMLANQMLILDSIFNNMAQRSYRQDTFRGIEVLMRLALKAQAQARSTAEALAAIKNPAPFIRQTNIAHGHQQVNNTVAHTPSHSGIQSHAGNSEIEPNKLLEGQHDNTLDIGAQAQAGRGHQALEAVGAVHRA